MNIFNSLGSNYNSSFVMASVFGSTTGSKEKLIDLLEKNMENRRKYPGAYLVQWKAILEAQKRGIKIYNFWGVAPEESSGHRFSGLSLFKRGFGG